MADRARDELLVLEEELKGTAYRPIAALGRGGMGSVYEVEHRTLKRRLVVKVLREVDRPDLEDRLRLEAQTLAKLDHPNIVQVIDFARGASGRPFLATERLYGQTLKERVAEAEALPVELAARLVSEALAGLGAAHRAGVVHRDVKLDNLFLCAADEHGPERVKVIDFGIAKLVSEGRAALDLEPLANATAQGLMVGTPSFMAPEQITGLAVDHRADLYASGVVLFRLVAGRNPFICRDLIEYAAAHASEPPAPPSRFAALPLGLDEVVLKALAKDPAARYQTAAEMVEALRPFLSARVVAASRRAVANKTQAMPAPEPSPAPRPSPAPARDPLAGPRGTQPLRRPPPVEAPAEETVPLGTPAHRALGPSLPFVPPEAPPRPATPPLVPAPAAPRNPLERVAIGLLLAAVVVIVALTAALLAR